jgi:hypothetical protein
VQPSGNRLRATRASPPGLASGDLDRRATYSAALQQFDDLIDAASAIGPVSRPLPLYYAVHQAGKAIAAAWAEGEWRATGHGLYQDSRKWQDDILRFGVKPQKKPGVFGIVAATLGTALLTGRVELGALWSALPGANPPAGADSWPLALPVYPSYYAVVYPQSYEEGTGLPSLPSTVSVCLRGQPAPDDAEAVSRLLATYPGAAGARVTTYQENLQFSPTPWGPGVGVMWPRTDMQEQGGPSSGGLSGLYVHDRAPEYRSGEEHWLIPRVGDGSDCLSPVLLWWILLFGLSLLARYEPAAWRAALNLDQSPVADPLTQLLDDALVIVPDLLFDAATQDRGTIP